MKPQSLVSKALEKISFCFFAAFFAFCGLAFADTIHLKNGEKIENAKLTEITQTDVKYKIGQREVVYTISKNDVQKVVYNDGQEDVFAVVEETVPKQEGVQLQEEVAKDSMVKNRYLFNIGYLNGLEISAVKEATYEPKESSWLVRYGPGFGLVLSLDSPVLLTPFFFNAYFGFKKSYFEYFLNNRLGTNIICGEDLFCFFYEPSIGMRYTNLSLSLGYNFLSNSYENSLAIRSGYRFKTETNVNRLKTRTESKIEPKEEKESSRFFRPGIEFNYPVWRSEVAYFDNSFSDDFLGNAGAGLFLRIGPEFFYFTTGAYARFDNLKRSDSHDLDVYGINVTSIPLSHLSLTRLFVEIPLLLSFGSEQIKFTGGALVDFYAYSEVDWSIAGQSVMNSNDADLIYERFEEPTGDLYFALGLDFDILRHWGIGAKFLIWDTSFGGDESFVDPPHFQARVSTYFVF